MQKWLAHFLLDANQDLHALSHKNWIVFCQLLVINLTLSRLWFLLNNFKAADIKILNLFQLFNIKVVNKFCKRGGWRTIKRRVGVKKNHKFLITFIKIKLQDYYIFEKPLKIEFLSKWQKKCWTRLNKKTNNREYTIWADL